MNIGKIRIKFVELAALMGLEKSPYTCIGITVLVTLAPSLFDWIFYILASKEGMHKHLDEFEFRQDPITNYGVSCP